MRVVNESEDYREQGRGEQKKKEAKSTKQRWNCENSHRRVIPAEESCICLVRILANANSRSNPESIYVVSLLDEVFHRDDVGRKYLTGIVSNEPCVLCCNHQNGI